MKKIFISLIMVFMPFFVLWTIQNYLYNGSNMYMYNIDILTMIRQLSTLTGNDFVSSFNKLIDNFNVIVNTTWLDMIETFNNLDCSDLFSFFAMCGQFFVGVGQFFYALFQFLYYGVVGVLSFFVDILLFSYRLLSFIVKPTFKKMTFVVR